MKRIVYFILLCILVLPFGVFAKEDVEITKIERIDKSDTSE